MYGEGRVKRQGTLNVIRDERAGCIRVSERNNSLYRHVCGRIEERRWQREQYVEE